MWLQSSYSRLTYMQQNREQIVGGTAVLLVQLSGSFAGSETFTCEVVLCDISPSFVSLSQD